MSLDTDPMKKALMSRRGKGLDVSIIIGNPEDDDKNTDLAPKQDHPLDESVHGQMDSQDGHADAFQDADLLKGMSDYDMKDMSGRAPRSLGERARQDAMGRMSK